MKLNNVFRVEIVFENCEYIEVPIKDIRYMTVGSLFEDLRLNNILKKESHRLERSLHCESFYIKFINKKDYHRVFECSDVAQIHLYDEESNKEWFFVPFGYEEFYNNYQSTKIEDDMIIVDIREDN